MDQILIVEPNDVASLEIAEGEDYCTLVTCTPYGVNTHRLLVRGHRIDNSTEVRVSGDAFKLDSSLIAPVIAAPILLILLIWLLWSTRRSKRKSGEGADSSGIGEDTSKAMDSRKQDAGGSEEGNDSGGAKAGEDSGESMSPRKRDADGNPGADTGAPGEELPRRGDADMADKPGEPGGTREPGMDGDPNSDSGKAMGYRREDPGVGSGEDVDFDSWEDMGSGSREGVGTDASEGLPDFDDDWDAEEISMEELRRWLDDV